MPNSGGGIVKALEEELTNNQSMQAVLGRAIRLAEGNGVSAYDLTLLFAEACFNKCVRVAEDAWFEHGFHYAEIRVGEDQITWGKL